MKLKMLLPVLLVVLALLLVSLSYLDAGPLFVAHVTLSVVVGLTAFVAAWVQH
jgi:uncharacterized membrane protein (DUF485 family)